KLVITTVLIYVVIAAGIQTFNGLTGFISLGHVAFVAIGAYVSSLLTTSVAIKSHAIPNAPEFLIHLTLGFFPAVLIALLFAMAIASIIGVAISRLSFASAPVATVAWLIVVWVINSNLSVLTRGEQTFYGIPRYATIWTALLISIGALLVARIFRDSAIG